MGSIRKAVLADIPEILSMGAAMHAESPRYRTLDFDEEKLFNLAQYLIVTPSAGGTLVAESQGRIAGMLAFAVGEFYFGKDKYASDVVMYLKPEHRGGSLFPRMVAAFEKWADEFGVKEKQLGVSADIDSERVVAVLLRLGYAKASTGTVKRN